MNSWICHILFRSCTYIVAIAMVPLGGKHLIDEVLPWEVGHQL
ncbi:hypothetical protein HanPSC8_Chr03g0124541 [Helianthus annuus]|nr:hypothetical protein HanPSC8_Chr03g0124541 [Helianthus annuus]